MTKEEIEQFCDNRKADIDRWTLAEKSLVSIAYWFWIEKNKHRVFEVAGDLGGAITKCINAEGDIKAGKPKQLKPPSPQSKVVTCYNCGYNYLVEDGNPPPTHCFSCGNTIY